MCQSKNLLRKGKGKHDMPWVRLTFFFLWRPRVPHHFHGDSIPSIYSEHFWSSRDPGSSPPVTEVKWHTTSRWAGHSTLLYLPPGDGTGQPPHRAGSSSGGGLASPSLPGTPSPWHHPGKWANLPRSQTGLLLNIAPWYTVLWSPLKHTNSRQETLCRNGEPQVHGVTLANYFGINLKEWSNSLSIFTLWNHVSTLWSGLHTFLFKYHLKKKKKEPKSFKSNLEFN